ncbi:peptidylprolyl isomerase [Aeoliella sp.]|uniref:peptidylprolyl isomerase n=1 Tax=Aeoliella sp. TaxID=2795800 RepID=UPI003CCC38AC
MSRFLLVAIVLLGTCTVAMAQTLRFETNVGDFDMVLNPNDDPNLQPLVDNMVAYVGLGRYHFTAINRAVDRDNDNPADDFVLQMGGFLAFQPTTGMWPQLASAVERLPEAIVDENGDGNVDFDSISNTRGTVSLALAGSDVNSGTSSFFINLGNNSSLDSQGFVPFAEIQNMSTIDTIMGLDQVDLSNDFGSPGNLTFIDVPVVEEDRLVLIRRVTVVEADDEFSFVGPIATALQEQNLGSDSSALSSLSTSSLSSDIPATSALMSTNVPEPSALWLLAPLALWGASRMRRR